MLCVSVGTFFALMTIAFVVPQQFAFLAVLGQSCKLLCDINAQRPLACEYQPLFIYDGLNSRKKLVLHQTFVYYEENRAHFKLYFCDGSVVLISSMSVSELFSLLIFCCAKFEIS